MAHLDAAGHAIAREVPVAYTPQAVRVPAGVGLERSFPGLFRVGDNWNLKTSSLTYTLYSLMVALLNVAQCTGSGSKHNRGRLTSGQVSQRCVVE